MTRREVPVAVVQRAFHESGLSVRELARRMNRHHSGVGRVVRGWKAKQYVTNADAEVVRYESRTLSMSPAVAETYLRAMGYDRRDVAAFLSSSER